MNQKKVWSNLQYIRVATSFGLTTGLRIYILGILGGNWLDEKLGTPPWFMLIGIVIAIILSFKFLLEQIIGIEKIPKNGGN